MSNFTPLERRLYPDKLSHSMYDLAAGLPAHSPLARQIHRKCDYDLHHKYNAKCKLPDTKFTYWRKAVNEGKEVYEQYPLTAYRYDFLTPQKPIRRKKPQFWYNEYRRNVDNIFDFTK